MRRSNGLVLCLSLLLVAGCATNSPKDKDMDALQAVEGDLQAAGGEQTQTSLTEINVNRAAEYIRLGIKQESERNHEQAKSKYRDAMQLLDEILQADRDYAPAHMTIAYLYERLNLFAEADKHYQRTIKINPNYADAHNNYGQFLCKQGKHSDAIRHFNAALDQPLYGKKLNTYVNAGMCAIRAQQYEQAHQYLLEAINLNPYFLPALLQMANVKYYLQDNASAKLYLDRYVDLAETHTPQTLVLGIRIEKAQHNYDAVARYTSLLRVQFPDAPETLELNSILQQTHMGLSGSDARRTVKLKYSEDTTEQ